MINHQKGLSLQVSKLYKSFDFESFILNNLNFTIQGSESVAILGPSGTGKSVLMKILGTLISPTAGSIKIGNTDITSASQREKRSKIKKIGFLFQHPGLFDHLNLLENVAFKELFLDKNQNDKEQILNIAKEKLKIVCIDQSSFLKKPNEISGGMQKRVAFARILMQEPELILLDEPTSGLDPVMSESINNTILDIRNLISPTIITITHDLNSALKISDRIIFLKNGQIIFDDKKDLILNSDNSYIAEYVSCANIKN